MGVRVIGMSFSPQCSGRPSDQQNLDRVCPNRAFFQGIGALETFYAPDHGSIMNLQKSIYFDTNKTAQGMENYLRNKYSFNRINSIGNIFNIFFSNKPFKLLLNGNVKPLSRWIVLRNR